MANINKIRLSGQTYDIQDPNASKTVELTQAQYDALTVKDPNTFYIITDAEGADLSNYYTKSEADDLLDTKLDASAYTPTDLSNYYTKSETSGATEISTALNAKADAATTYTKTETDNAITAATSTKQDTLVSGTNIKTINNESILGSGNIDIQGGGKAISAGTNISITTRETADTINCTLPIIVNQNSNYSLKLSGNDTYINFANYSVTEGYKGGIDDSSHYSHKEGYYSKIENYCQGSHVEGYYCEVKYNSKYSHAEGYYTKTTNESEHSSGRYNVSNKANSTFGDSGNTLFSVGNGTDDNARHNAFEIRQNGDIYCSDGTNDVKLQDTIAATAANTTALGGLKLAKLTQSEYDALTTKDDNTVYFIGDSNGYTMKIGNVNVN